MLSKQLLLYGYMLLWLEHMQYTYIYITWNGKLFIPLSLTLYLHHDLLPFPLFLSLSLPVICQRAIAREEEAKSNFHCTYSLSLSLSNDEEVKILKGYYFVNFFMRKEGCNKWTFATVKVIHFIYSLCSISLFERIMERKMKHLVISSMNILRTLRLSLSISYICVFIIFLSTTRLSYYYVWVINLSWSRNTDIYTIILIIMIAYIAAARSVILCCNYLYLFFVLNEEAMTCQRDKRDINHGDSLYVLYVKKGEKSLC